MLLQVEVPEGLMAGDTMEIAVGEDQFTVTVPHGTQGGDVIDIDLPVDTPMEESPAQVSVVVPEGCFAGSDFLVSFEDQEFTITVPDGYMPGDVIEVEVPQMPPSKLPKEREWQEQLEPPQEPEQEVPERLVGLRAMICSLITNGLLNGRKGTLQSYDAEKGLFKLAVDNMYPYISIRRENLLPLPWEAEPDDSKDEEPLEAPPAGIHYVGDRVLVERSNGHLSQATIVEYDEVFETFTVDVGNGMLKYGVEESYITPHETTAEWAGPPHRVHGVWEGFFVGRRVRVPTTLPRSHDDYDDDRDGEVCGYDQPSGSYVVALDSGVTRRVPYNRIKVVYRMRGVMA